MNKLNAVVVDDEPLAREGIVKYAQQIDFLDVKGVCKNAVQANSMLQQEKIDLLFLDIEMPGLSGLNFLKALAQPPFVIFTTAYPQYALEGYQFDVIDYLVKPISFERFLQAVNKAWRMLNTSSAAPAEEFVFLKTDKKLVKVYFRDVLFLEGMQNYVHIHTVHEKLTVLSTLKSLLDLFPDSLLLSVHKSYVVALEQVEAVEGNELLIRQHRVPISVRQRAAVLERLVGD